MIKVFAGREYIRTTERIIGGETYTFYRQLATRAVDMVGDAFVVEYTNKGGQKVTNQVGSKKANNGVGRLKSIANRPDKANLGNSTNTPAKGKP